MDVDSCLPLLACLACCCSCWRVPVCWLEFGQSTVNVICTMLLFHGFKTYWLIMCSNYIYIHIRLPPSNLCQIAACCENLLHTTSLFLLWKRKWAVVFTLVSIRSCEGTESGGYDCTWLRFATTFYASCPFWETARFCPFVVLTGLHKQAGKGSPVPREHAETNKRRCQWSRGSLRESDS